MSSPAIALPVPRSGSTPDPVQRNTEPEASVLPNREVQQSDIAALAYSLWEKRGRPEGSAEVDWIEAERTVMAK
jgi:Protein of unknown function (DUF2934)